MAAALAPSAAIDDACDMGRIGDRLRRCVVVLLLPPPREVAYVGLAERVGGTAGDVEMGASVGLGTAPLPAEDEDEDEDEVRVDADDMDVGGM